MIKVLNKDKEQTNIYYQICDECQTELEFAYEGAYGLFYIKCPECGREIVVEKINPTELTSQNIEFPKHFVGPGGVDIANIEIQEWVKNCLSNLEEAEDGEFYMTASGNTIVIALKYADTYDIYVSDKYYECVIPR